MAALDCNQTNSFITLQQNNFLENAQAENSSACNMFDRLPNEVIQNCLAPNLTPNEALTMRLVNRRFAILFGDKHVWHIYYNIHGLKLPENNPIMANELALSSQAKQFNFWRNFKKEMDRRKFEEELEWVQTFTFEPDRFDPKLFRNHSKISRSFFITILAIPVFSLLHEYAMQILTEHFHVPAELSVKEIMLRIAKKELDVDDSARKLAIRYIAKYAMEPEVKQTLVSIVTSPRKYCPITVALEALEAVVPYLSETTLQVAQFIAYYGSIASIKIGLDTQLIENPEILRFLIFRLAKNSDFYKIINNYLTNAIIVKQLVQSLYNQDYTHVRSQLILALEPIADQEFVQEALCKLLLRLQSGNDEITIIIYVLSKTRLVDCIKERYRHQIPVLQELINAEEMINNANRDIVNRRQLLLNALKSENTFARAKAAIVLTPLVLLDPVIVSVFLERLAKERGEVGIAIISALSTIAHRKDIRQIIIREELDCREFTAGRFVNEVVQALLPFTHEPEVCETFIDLLKKNPYPPQYELFNILAPQLDKQNVVDFFLEMAENVNNVPRSCQIMAIDKIAMVVNEPKVQMALLKIYTETESKYDVKAACIRALCIDQANPLIPPTQLLKEFLDESREISLAAIQALESWL